MYLPSFRKKQNGVPFLSKLEINSMAERFILDFSPEALNNPMEIDIDSFVQYYLGLKQDFQYLSHNGIYLGMTVFNDTNRIPVYIPEINEAEYISVKAGTVLIDNSLLEEGQEHRYRYTMGHEGAHDILHKGYFRYDPQQLSFLNFEDRPMIQCRALPANGKIKPVTQWNDKDTMEWQANYFSSALLMPKTAVKKMIEAMPYNGESDYIRSLEYIMSVVKAFNVSNQAAEYRLKELGFLKNPRREENIPDIIF